MSDNNLVKTQNRWLVVIAAIVMELALGALYMWGGAFVGKIELISGWDKQSAQLPFSVGVIAFALMVIFAGRYKERIGTRNLILLSASVMGGGYIIGGLLPISPLVTTLTIGAIAGAGSGLAYALPVSVGTKWFPDKKGLVVGLSMAGFGAGSLIWIYAADILFDVLKLEIGIIWIVYGICYALMIGFSYIFLYDPPAGYTVPGYEPPVAKVGSSAENIDFEDMEMLRTPQFYLIFLTFMIGAAAGLMVIGIAKVWPKDVLEAAGFSAIEAAAAATFAAGVMYPLFNGLGRIGYGALNDRIGWKKSMLIMNSVQAVFMFLSLFLISTPITLWIVMAVLAANYGGNFSLFPTATDNLWGSKHLAANYGLVFFAFGIGGLLGPNIGGIFRNSGQQEIAIVISGVMLIISVILIWFTEKPTKN
jgi:OFA family oxalate/formate antiporter-like MFS transporter